MTTTVTSLNGKYWSGLTLDQVKENVEGNDSYAFDKAILRFNKVDTDCDGTLSVDEIRAYDLKKKRQRTTVAIVLGTIAAIGIACLVRRNINLKNSLADAVSTLKTKQTALDEAQEVLDSDLGKVVKQQIMERKSIDERYAATLSIIERTNYGATHDMQDKFFDIKDAGLEHDAALSRFFRKYAPIEKEAKKLLEA